MVDGARTIVRNHFLVSFYFEPWFCFVFLLCIASRRKEDVVALTLPTLKKMRIVFSGEFNCLYSMEMPTFTKMMIALLS